MGFLETIVARLKEPSSYAALASVLAMVGVNVDPGLWQAIVVAATGVSGLAAFFLSEKGAAASE